MEDLYGVKFFAAASRFSFIPVDDVFWVWLEGILPVPPMQSDFPVQPFFPLQPLEPMQSAFPVQPLTPLQVDLPVLLFGWF